MNLRRFAKDTGGDASVEAAILFPIMIMIFAALALLAIYLPTRAALQRATQYAATAVATEISDTWIFYDEQTMIYTLETNKDSLPNVYAALFTACGRAADKGEDIIITIESRGISSKAGELSVYCYAVNYIIYQEIVASAKREFTVPMGLSFIRFPETFEIEVTSTAVVQNGDEFVRDIDMAADFLSFLAEKYNLTDISSSISSFWGETKKLFGW